MSYLGDNIDDLPLLDAAARVTVLDQLLHQSSHCFALFFGGGAYLVSLPLLIILYCIYWMYVIMGGS